MHGWSITLFRVRGIRLAVHASFLLLMAWVATAGWIDGGRWLGAAWSLGTLLAFFACVVLHEFGHSFTAMHFGIGVRRVLLLPIGGVAEFDSIPRQPSRELWITLAGPAVNFVIAAGLWLAVGNSPDGDYPATAVGLAQLLIHANLVMGCFNLIPAFPMDGGRILRALLACRMPYFQATRWAATIGKAVCLVSIVAALFAPGVSLFANRFMLTALFSFIFVAGEFEYRAVWRSEREERRSRAFLLQRAA